MAQRRIFISYSRKDQELVERLTADLIAAGAEIWLDLKDIIPGANWGESIQEGLDSAEEMVLVLSPDAVASKNVALEWQYYFDNNKTIIPILLHPVKIPFQLNRLQYVDFNKLGYDNGLLRLKQRLGLMAIAPPTPTPVMTRQPDIDPPIVATPSSPSAPAAAAAKPQRERRLPILPIRLALPATRPSGRKVAIVGGASLVIIVAIVLLIMSRSQNGLRVGSQPTATRTSRLVTSTSSPTRRVATTAASTVPTGAIAVATKPGTFPTIRPSATKLPATTASTLTGKIFFLSNRTGLTSYEIYTMNADGSGIKQLTNYAKDGVKMACPRWSDESQQFVVGVTYDKTKTSCKVCNVIQKLNADGTKPVTLTTAEVSYAPEWSPDGKTIAYICNNNLCTIDSSGRSFNRLTSDTSVKAYVSWSSNGTSLYYNVNSNINKLDLTNKKSTQITNATVYTFGAVESPNGKQIVYSVAGTSSSDASLWLMNSDGTNPRKLATLGNSGRWSPDGRYILYTSGGTLNVFDTQTSATTKLTNTGQDFCADWGPTS